MRFIDEMIDRKRREARHGGWGQDVSGPEMGPPPGFDRADLPAPLDWPPHAPPGSSDAGGADPAGDRMSAPATGGAGEPEPAGASPRPGAGPHASGPLGMRAAVSEAAVAPDEGHDGAGHDAGEHDLGAHAGRHGASRLDRVAPFGDDDPALDAAQSTVGAPTRPPRTSPFRAAAPVSRPAGLVGRAGAQPGRRRLGEARAGDLRSPAGPPEPSAGGEDRQTGGSEDRLQDVAEPLRLVDLVRSGRDVPGRPDAGTTADGAPEDVGADPSAGSPEDRPASATPSAAFVADPGPGDRVASRPPGLRGEEIDPSDPEPYARLGWRSLPPAQEAVAPATVSDRTAEPVSFRGDASGSGLAPDSAAPQDSASGLSARALEAPAESGRPDTGSGTARRGCAASAAPETAADLPEPPPPPAGRVKTRLLGFRGPESADDDGHDPLGRTPRSASAAAGARFPVGWLVIERGPGRGTAFALFDGLSTLGRGDGQTVQLDLGDTAISRDTHAAVAYDDERRGCWLGHGGKANLVRLNGRPVLTTEALSNGDRIRIGETTLRFVALCGPDFSWSDDAEEGAPDAAAL